jgi:transposase
MPAQARRARLILLLADGEFYGLIRKKLDCDTNFIARWKGRFEAERLAGLYSRHAGRAARKGSERQEAVFFSGPPKESQPTAPREVEIF